MGMNENVLKQSICEVCECKMDTSNNHPICKKIKKDFLEIKSLTKKISEALEKYAEENNIKNNLS